MSDLEFALREKTTEELQEALRQNSLIEEAAGIARKVLDGRGAEIPIPKTDEEVDADGRASRNRSTVAVITFILCFALYLYTKSYWAILPFMVVLARNKRDASR
jgi:hypothetical protein